jgi:hypothetical protein
MSASDLHLASIMVTMFFSGVTVGVVIANAIWARRS